jgi:hypothetical protein
MGEGRTGYAMKSLLAYGLSALEHVMEQESH